MYNQVKPYRDSEYFLYEHGQCIQKKLLNLKKLGFMSGFSMLPYEDGEESSTSAARAPVVTAVIDNSSEETE